MNRFCTTEAVGTPVGRGFPRGGWRPAAGRWRCRRHGGGGGVGGRGTGKSAAELVGAGGRVRGSPGEQRGVGLPRGVSVPAPSGWICSPAKPGCEARGGGVVPDRCLRSERGRRCPPPRSSSGFNGPAPSARCSKLCLYVLEMLITFL